MGIRSIIGGLANNLLAPLGLELTARGTTERARAKKRVRFPTGEERMAHAASLGFRPRVLFDGGAYDGRWSMHMAKLFPGAQLVLFEPNPFIQDKLREHTAHITPSVVVQDVAIAERPGEATFHIYRDPQKDPGASLLGHVSGEAATPVPVRLDTLDHVCEQLGLLPDVLKLDLQGAEGNAIRGATKALAHAELVIAEFGCLEAYIGRTTPRELMDLLYDRGFVLYDLVECHYRPYDGALTGGDFFFVKADSPLRAHKGWQ